ncbi:hypothetical protein E5D57_013418 [Metarhizium anisopliae]|nr:hypothetical protein E5D57_013405 [Metarhizium anisopliae]KAF5121082.1 hypothetical protein E5D57_013418 [Metarhizium anisopliae]
MSPTTTPSAYNSLDAAKAAQSGAFLTAWPADETVISLPSLTGLSLETGYRKSSSGEFVDQKPSAIYNNCTFNTMRCERFIFAPLLAHPQLKCFTTIVTNDNGSGDADMRGE